MMKDLILVAIFFLIFFFFIIIKFQSSWITKLYKTSNEEVNLERKRWPKT